MDKRSYKVTSPIRFGGKNYDIGATVELTDEEARQFADCIVDAEPREDGDETAGLFAEINRLREEVNSRWAELVMLNEKNETLAAQLKEKADELTKHQEAMATLVDEHEATLAGRDKSIADLNAQIAELKKSADGKEKKK